MIEVDRRTGSFTVSQATRSASDGEWGVPEFQREFVWLSGRVASLAKTVVHGWSLSCWHLWRARKEQVRHRAGRLDLQQASDWILDGQQRLTALCIIVGRRPAWYGEAAWKRLLASHAPALDLRALTRGNPVVGEPQVAADHWLPLPDMFVDSKRLQAELNKRRYGNLYGAVRDIVARIENYAIPVVTLHGTPADVVQEQFRLLNQNATRVPPAIVRQGLLAVMAPGFTVDRVDPLRDELSAAGWPVKATTVINSFLATARVSKVEQIDPQDIPELWSRFHAAWRSTIAYLRGNGIHGLSCWPAERMLTAMVIAAETWPDAVGDDRFARWAICAQWDGHQARGSELPNDIAILQAARRDIKGWDDTFEELCRRLDPNHRPLKASELTDPRTSPDMAAGARERLLYAATRPVLPIVAKNARVPVWVALSDGPVGLADWGLVLGTARSGEQQPAVFDRSSRASQSISTKHVSSDRAKSLAATMNATLTALGSGIRPSTRHR